jgi:hypothetical protein
MGGWWGEGRQGRVRAVECFSCQFSALPSTAVAILAEHDDAGAERAVEIRRIEKRVQAEEPKNTNRRCMN